jgi:diguanylate cyclase (GGDEF)-like protein
MIHNKHFESVILTSLVFLTVFIASLQELALKKTLTFNANSAFVINNINDSQTGLGESSSVLTSQDDNLILKCDIVRKNYEWPFCEIQILLFDNEHKIGLDLSSFDRVTVAASYKENKSASIRFQIRSYEPEYSNLKSDSTWKYNGIEYWPEKSSYPTKIPMRSLQVATWWLNEQEIPIEHSSPSFKNSMVIEVATGNNLAAGQHTLILEHITFHGQYFKHTHVYAAIILLWVFFASILLAAKVIQSRRQLSIAMKKTVELKKLNKLLNVESKTLKDKAERDPLTGALNRSGIKPIFTEEILVLSLMFLDIDHFKAINDKYGHNVGDEILKLFVKIISENSRSTDFIARWGGEEFLLVCPNTTLHSVQELAEEMRLLVERYEWPHGIKMTSSFGIAQRNKNEPATEFIERADKALYTAKARGRNQVIVAQKI